MVARTGDLSDDSSWNEEKVLLLKAFECKLRTFKYVGPVYTPKSIINCNIISTTQCNEQQTTKYNIYGEASMAQYEVLITKVRRRLKQEERLIKESSNVINWQPMERKI